MNVCLVCLGEGDTIEYDHCGKYYIHLECLERWNIEECIICRKKIIEDELLEHSSIDIQPSNNLDRIHERNSASCYYNFIFGCLSLQVVLTIVVTAAILI